jgi:hypothetical protein
MANVQRRENQIIREWAESKGYLLEGRGRIPVEIKEEFYATENPKPITVVPDPEWVTKGRERAQQKAVKRVVYFTTIAQLAIDKVA